MGIKLILYLNILVLVFSIQKIDCKDTVPQIKIVGSQIRFLNQLFHDSEGAVVFTIRHINETSNYVTLYWDLKQDLPADIALYTKVYATDSTYQGGKLILDNITPLCKPNKNRDLLPTMLQVPDSLMNTQCLKKGVYQMDNSSQYRFEVLVPNIETLGSYFRAEHKVANDYVTIGAVNFYSELGSLNN